MSGELALRAADETDLEALAEIYLRARAAAVPAMPATVHPPDEVRRWVCSWDLARREVWVAQAGSGRLLGYAAATEEWLDDLYVDPASQRHGVGRALLDLVVAARPRGFCLWVFSANEPARAFYAAQGLVELEHTDGSGNEEHCPDVRMAWPGRDPLAFYRAMIDDVDAELGDLLARRAALTAVVQRIKSSTARDADRERQIVTGLAQRAPALGEQRLARILDVLVAESVAAATEREPRR